MSPLSRTCCVHTSAVCTEAAWFTSHVTPHTGKKAGQQPSGSPSSCCVAAATCGGSTGSLSAASQTDEVHGARQPSPGPHLSSGSTIWQDRGPQLHWARGAGLLGLSEIVWLLPASAPRRAAPRLCGVHPCPCRGAPLTTQGWALRFALPQLKVSWGTHLPIPHHPAPLDSPDPFSSGLSWCWACLDRPCPVQQPLPRTSWTCPWGARSLQGSSLGLLEEPQTRPYILVSPTL